jgi:hypothetical protein
LCILSVPQEPATNKGKESLKTNKTQQKEQTQNYPPVAVQCYPQTPQTQPKSDNSDAEPKSWLYRLYLLSGPIIGVVTVGTLVLVWKQIKALHNVERAWLLQSVEDVLPVQIDKKGPWTAKTAVFQVKNWGKTPARLKKVTLKVAVVEKITELGVLAKYKGSTVDDIEGRPIAPGESMTLNLENVATKDVTEPEWDEVAKETKIAVFYVEVHYSDTFSRKHLTTFCYRYVKRPMPFRGTSETCGGNKYNKAT